MSVVLTVAPTGPIAFKSDNQFLPTSPEEIASAVHGAYLEGATVAHLHLRDEAADPRPELDALGVELDGRPEGAASLGVLELVALHVALQVAEGVAERAAWRGRAAERTGADARRNAAMAAALRRTRDASAALQTAEARLEFLEKRAEPEALEAVRIAREGFAAGRFTLLDVLDAEAALNSLQSDLITAELDRAIALAALVRAITRDGSVPALWFLSCATPHAARGADGESLAFAPDEISPVEEVNRLAGTFAGQREVLTRALDRIPPALDVLVAENELFAAELASVRLLVEPKYCCWSAGAWKPVLTEPRAESPPTSTRRAAPLPLNVVPKSL